jgi:hypothetical protein
MSYIALARTIMPRQLPIPVVLLAGLLVLAGCTTTRRSLSVNPFSTSGSALHPYDGALTGERATIELVDGTTRQGDIRRIQVDSLFWIDRATSTERALPLTDVRAIEVRQRFRGAWQGFRLGSGIGAGVLMATTAVGLLREGKGSPTDIVAPWTRYFTVGLATAAIITYGSIIAGFIRGATVRYEIALSEALP